MKLNSKIKPSKKYCILLTGTIKPKNIISLKRTDPGLREKDYYNAINKWLSLDFPVVFCDNSNFKSDKINNIKNPNFELLQYKENYDLTEKGKGYGEFQIMKFAMAHSLRMKKYDYIVKITGRLYVRNLLKIIKKIDTVNFDIVAPLENNLKWSDSRLIIFQKNFFSDYFNKYGEQINDSTGNCFERALAKAIHALLSDDKNWEMLPIFPNYEGYSGTYNKKYHKLTLNTIEKIFRFPLINYLIRK